VTTPYLAFPVQVGAGGALRTAETGDHVDQLVLQTLFTEPGERVNLPEFGCGVQRLVFAANSDLLRATARFLITQSLERWLGDVIDVESVDVSSPEGEDEQVEIEIAYVIRQAQVRRVLSVPA